MENETGKAQGEEVEAQAETGEAQVAEAAVAATAEEVSAQAQTAKAAEQEAAESPESEDPEDPEEQQPTPEQIHEARKALMKGVPTTNIGALFMPAIWGPAHGIWITILYYPIWLLADNMFYGVYSDPRPITVVFAVLGIIALAGVTLAFARAGQQQGLLRALEQGKTKEEYLESEKKWAIAMVIVAVIALAAATYYNLCVRGTLGA